MEKLDAENLAISLDKSEFTCKQVEWLLYTINNEGTKPLTGKTEAIEKLSPPKTLKQPKKNYGLITPSHRVHPKFSINGSSTTSFTRKKKKIKQLIRNCNTKHALEIS